MSDKSCCFCKVVLFGDFFTCKGFLCDRATHYCCAGLKSKQATSFKTAMSTIKGLSWFCEDCDNNTKSLLTKLDDILSIIKKTDIRVSPSSDITLQSEDDPDKAINQHHETSNKIITSINSTIPPAKIVRPNTRLHSRLIAESIVIPELVRKDPLADETNSEKTKSSEKQNEVSNLNSNSTDPSAKTSTQNVHAISPTIPPIPTSPEIMDTIAVVEPRRWIFISRIHHSVTDEQFKWFLRNKLQVTDANVKRMNPRSVNGNNCDHISYRISVPETCFANILNSNIWPPGLLIKEFEFRPYNSFFRNFGPWQPPS